MPEEFWGFPNAATPPGSPYYYVARFTQASRRDEVAAWLAWFSHIDRLERQAQEPAVARLKLDWWREEAGLTLHDKARHPIARFLAPGVTDTWQVAEMRRAIDGVEQRILGHSPRDKPDFFRLGEDAWSCRMALLGRSDDDRVHRLAHAAGRYMSTVDRLHHLARDIHAGHLPLPVDLSEARGLTASRLRTQEELPALTEVGEELLGAAEREWQAVRSEARTHPSLDPVLRLAAQADRVARLLRRHAFQTHRQTPLPTPIGLLWSAWRSR